MLKQLITIIRPPIFPNDEDKTRKASYANVIAFAFLVIAIGLEVWLRFFGNYARLTVLDLSVLVVFTICITGLILLRHGHVRFTSILLVIMTWVASNGLSATVSGVRDASYLVNFPIVLMTGLLLGWQASWIVTILSMLSGLALGYAEQYNLIRIRPYAVSSFALDISVILVLNGILMGLLITGLENALKRSRTSLTELASANTNLSRTQNELQDRSNELIVANKQLENRTQKLHAIAMVTRTAASMQDFNLLLASITSVISLELGYHHVGLFLLDEQREFAILRSANTEGGLRMINRGYRIPVGQLSAVGFVAQIGKPRIVLAASEDSVFLNSPDLPNSRSEIVLPLKSGDQIVGVLDIQSSEPNAFIEDDLSTLSILADQVGITIQNLLLYEHSQSALRKADIAFTQTFTQAWRGYESTIETKGYHYDGIKSEPLKDARQSNRRNSSLLIPIQLRGQTIGRFKLNPSDPSREWTDDELVIVKATAERVALALESARLLDEAQQRATREAFLADVSTKLSASFQLDSILRDTVQELGQTLKNSVVTFQLVNPAELNNPKVQQADSPSAHEKEQEQ